VIRFTVPTEADEQKTVAAYLDMIGVLWCHVPNSAGILGSAKDGRRIGKLQKLKAMGQKPGVPDILIFSPRPIAIEMKRVKGSTTSHEQIEWHRRLRACGWTVAVCKGAQDAIDFLKSEGL
jgi:hypothetical protein